MAVAAFGCALQNGNVISNRDRRKVGDCGDDAVILRNIAGQFPNAEHRQLLALGLADVKDGNRAERLLMDQHRFLDRCTGRIQDRPLAIRVDLFGLDHAGVRTGC